MRESSVGEFLDQLAARVPAPGGGAVAALHAAQSAALLGMVARYSTGERYAKHAPLVRSIIRRADDLRARATELAETDAEAFGEVAAAYRMPSRTPEAAAIRQKAITSALLRAAQPPAAVLGVSTLLVELAEELLPVGNRNVATDVAAAAEAARAAAATARVNIEVNLAGIEDSQARRELSAETALADEVADRAARVTAAVRRSLGH